MAMTTVVMKPNLHPLLIDVVVDNVFRYLRLKDIIKQRAVCKLWHHRGTKRLLNRIDEIEIAFGVEFSTDVIDSRKTVDRFLQIQRDCSFHFTNFASFYWKNNTDPRIPNVEQTTHLFNECGLHMKRAQLNLSGESESWKFLSDILVNKAPNLEQLCLLAQPVWEGTVDQKLFPEKEKPDLKLKTLILRSEVEFESPTYSRELLTDILKSSPHLECLSVALDCDNDGDERDYNNEVLVLETLRDNGNVSKLKELDLSVWNEDIFTILVTFFKSAPLKEVYVPIRDSDFTTDTIDTFLHHHKDTFEKLCFDFPCVDFLNNITFPAMKNLKALSIHEWCLDEKDLDELQAPFGIFNFGIQFPNLVTLELYEDPKTEGRSFFNFDEWFPGETTPLLTLKNLILPPMLDPVVLRRIGRIFPNVLKLIVVSQNPDVLVELWSTWPEIKSLDITLVSERSYLSTNINSIFTGLPVPALGILSHSQLIPADVESLKKFPSICQLKQLRHLIIDKGSYFINRKEFPGVDLMLKDETARMALANLKDLVFLHISKDCHQISPSCVQNLCTKLDLLEETKDTSALHLVKYEWQKQMRLWNPFLYQSLPNYV